MPDSSSSRSSSRNDSDPIVVVVPAYKKPSLKTVEHALRMIERTTDKVVFISCLTLVRHPGGMELPVKYVNDNVRLAAEQHQLMLLHVCLRNVRPLLEEKEVELEIHVKTGISNERILCQSAKELHPRWIIVDSSLSNLKRRLKRDPVLKMFNLGFVPEDSSVPVYNRPQNFFSVHDDVDLMSEPTVERNRSVGCFDRLFTFRRVANSM